MDMSIWRTILVGHLVVNLPVVCIIITVLFLGSYLVPWQLAAIGGSILGWVWWSFMVPRWRNWAHSRGVDPARLQKIATRTGLTWPQGSLLERTEFRKRDGK